MKQLIIALFLLCVLVSLSEAASKGDAEKRQKGSHFGVGAQHGVAVPVMLDSSPDRASSSKLRQSHRGSSPVSPPSRKREEEDQEKEQGKTSEGGEDEVSGLSSTRSRPFLCTVIAYRRATADGSEESSDMGSSSSRPIPTEHAPTTRTRSGTLSRRHSERDTSYYMSAYLGPIVCLFLFGFFIYYVLPFIRS